MIQFSLVMGCGQKYTPHMDNQVKLEYSTNHGLTWHLVQEVNLFSLKLVTGSLLLLKQEAKNYNSKSLGLEEKEQCYLELRIDIKSAMDYKDAIFCTIRY